MSWTTKALTCRQMWGINVCHLAPGLAADLWGDSVKHSMWSVSQRADTLLHGFTGAQCIVCCFFFCSCDYITESDLPLWACSAVIHHMSARRTFKEWLTSRSHTSGIHHLDSGWVNLHISATDLCLHVLLLLQVPRWELIWCHCSVGSLCTKTDSGPWGGRLAQKYEPQVLSSRCD